MSIVLGVAKSQTRLGDETTATRGNAEFGVSGGSRYLYTTRGKNSREIVALRLTPSLIHHQADIFPLSDVCGHHLRLMSSRLVNSRGLWKIRKSSMQMSEQC